MLFWQHKIPDFIIKRNTIVGTTVFTGIFALAFINFYSPFGVDKWFHLNRLSLFLYSSLVILTGMAVIVLNRIILFQIAKRFTINYLQYGISIFIEIASMAAFFSLFVKYVLADNRLFIEIIRASIKNTSLILLIPYTVLWLYYAYLDKMNQLKELKNNETSIDIVKDKMIPFNDEKGKLKFSVLLEDIIYIEASDNYISIHYEAKEKVAKFMVRNTLKNIEGDMEKLGILRCHRSFLVNFSKVKILKREKDGVFLELNTINEITIPVSKTYMDTVLSAFSHDYK